MNQLEKQEMLANKICNKPESIPIKTCHKNWGRTNPLCNEYEDCRILEKSREQIEYVFSPDSENIFLRACPGSGKTEVVGLKAAYTIREWHGQPGGLAVLTFTNNAADVISQRVSQFTGVEKTGYPHFIGTIDSWLHGYIAHPFAYQKTGYGGRDGDRSIRIVDNSSSVDFLYSYQTKYVLAQRGKPLANQYYFDVHPEGENIVFSSANQGMDDIWNAEHLEDWQIENLENTKQSFWKGGFATYQDVEYLCFGMLSEDTTLCSLISMRFPFIIVDECQDLSWIQLQILDKLREQGTVLHFVGDLNQAIYDFKRVDPQQIESYTKMHKFKPLSLSYNFRSCQPIIDVCRKIVGKDSPEESRRTQRFSKTCICVLYTEDQMQQLPLWFSNYLKTLSCDETKSAVATRNWNNVSRMRPSNNSRVSGPQKTLAASIYLWNSHERQALDDALKYIGRFISDKYFGAYSSNPRRHYCPECVDSHLQWRIFLSAVLNSCCAGTFSISDLSQLWPNWAQCVRNDFGRILREYLPIIENSFTEALPDFHDLNGNNFKIPRYTRESNVLETLPAFFNGEPITPLRITTIHSLKGETLDAILLVSAPSRQGTSDGHWTQWLAEADSEAARLAYVASSRPKHLLAWAVRKQISSKDKEIISDLGFSLIGMSE